MRRLTSVFLVFVLLAACSGVEEPTSVPTESADPTEVVVSDPEPTETTAAEATATAVDSRPENTPENTPPAEEPEAPATEPVPTALFQMDAWADNWFAAYLGEELIVEDSVSITTERSFNAETATFEAGYPLNLNFILKDFKENDTGLEYIGERNQQMGDGGFIMQITDLTTGDVVAVTNEAWACLVIHEAPLDKSCENEANPVAGEAPCTFTDRGEPEGWMSADFDDSGWTATTVHSASAVAPKGGYDQINWSGDAQFIWGPDLETNNTVLCRATVTAP